MTSILKYAWKRHKMLNILDAVINKNEVTKLEIRMIYYDPFKFSKTAIRGRVFNLNISSDQGDKISLIRTKMQNRLSNVHGYPIKICIFEITDMIVSIRDESGAIIEYDGILTKTFKILAESSNFTKTYLSPPANEMYGGRFLNGSSNGQLRIMENQLADIAVNLRIIKDYGSNMAIFLHSLDDVVYEFMTPEMGYAKRLYYENILDKTTYCFIAFGYVSILFMLVLMKKIRCWIKTGKILKTRDVDIAKYAVVIYGLLTLVSQPWPRNTQERILIISSTLVAIIVACSYQGTMYKMLSTQKTSLNYENLDELEQGKLELLASLTFKPNLNTVLENKASDRILKKATFITDIRGSIKRVATKEDAAIVIRDVVIDMYQAKYFDNKTGLNKFHKVAQPFISGSGGYMTHKMCPYIHRLNSIILHMMASGLVLREYKDLKRSVYLQLLKRPKFVGESDLMFKMSELQIVFECFCFGMAFSFCVFIIEIIFDRSTKKSFDIKEIKTNSKYYRGFNYF